jgi:hypothetical protein
VFAQQARDVAAELSVPLPGGQRRDQA